LKKNKTLIKEYMDNAKASYTLISKLEDRELFEIDLKSINYI
jgi:hypothetical protein